MVKGIQDWQGGSDEASLIAAVKAARQAGFEVFEPTLAEAGAIALGADEASVRRAGEIIRGEGLLIHALACPLVRRTPLSSPDDATQRQARELVMAALDRAAWIGAKILVVEAGRVTDVDDARTQRTSYADALNAVHAALDVLAYEAEARAVVIALENPADAFLLSPVEMRDLVDATASPWVQVCVDVAAVQRYGFPADWIETLAGRIVNVHVSDRRGDQPCPPGEGDIAWPAVVAALRQANYAGPLVCTIGGGPLDLALGGASGSVRSLAGASGSDWSLCDLARKLDRILADA